MEAGTILLRTIKENKVLIRKVLIGSNWSLRLARKADSKEGRGFVPKRARNLAIERTFSQSNKE